MRAFILPILLFILSSCGKNAFLNKKVSSSISTNLTAESKTWIKQIGVESVGPLIGDVSGTDVCYGMTIDTYGNSYCAGLTSGSMGESHSGSYDAFVVKLDPAGTIIWIKQLGNETLGFESGDNSNFEYALSIDVDLFGNVYFGGSTKSSLADTNAGEFDAYIAKLNSNGEFLWAKQLGANSNLPSGSTPTARDVCWDIAVTGIGEIYCGGYTYSSLGEVNGGGVDAFVSKFDTSGDLLWITQLGAVTSVPGININRAEYCVDIALDSAGNVYCGGSSTGSFGENNAGGTDILLMKLSSSGSIQWVKQVGAATTVPGGSASGNEHCQEITIDSQGDIYCSGATSSSLGEANGGGEDAFVAKFSSVDGYLAWVKQLGATTVTAGGDSSQKDKCYGVEVDNKGSVYCAGATAGSLGEANGGGDDIFVMKLSANNGDIEWIRQLGAVSVPSGGDTSADEFCHDAAVDPSGNIFCVGRTKGNLDETIGGSSDAVILKLSPDGNL